MAGTDPLSGARYPGSADSPNVSQDIQNAVNDLSDLLGGIFSTASARDTAYATWVSQGNTMRDGLECRVAGYPQVYRSGSWRGVSTIPRFTGTADGTLYTTTQYVMTVSIPDPGYPYQVLIGGSVLLSQVGVNVVLAPKVYLSGVHVPPQGANVSGGAGGAANLLASTGMNGMSGVVTGATTAQLQIVILSGPAGNGYQCATTGAYNMLSAQVIPA